MINLLDAIKKLLNDLFPYGLAFRAAPDKSRQKLINAISLSFEKANLDARSILDDAVADNPYFTEEDASDWERRLGLISGTGVPLPDRILAINRKLNYPGSPAPRQHWSFIEQQLQASGFDVYIYENNFGGVTKTPEEILYPGAPSGSVHSEGTYHKNTTLHGSTAFYKNKIANYIEEERDEQFLIGPNYRSTFFIAGPTIDAFADVPANRKAEFRQMILRLKPAQTVGFLFINYV